MARKKMHAGRSRVLIFKRAFEEHLERDASRDEDSFRRMLPEVRARGDRDEMEAYKEALEDMRDMMR